MEKKKYEFYTPAEVADLLQVTRRTVYDWIKSGKLEAVQVGRGWRISRETLDRLTGTEEEKE